MLFSEQILIKSILQENCYTDMILIKAQNPIQLDKTDLSGIFKLNFTSEYLIQKADYR